jgi:hypothetical protein
VFEYALFSVCFIQLPSSPLKELAMKPFILLPHLFVLLSSFFIAQTSSAYLQYTYASDALEWQSSFLNNEDFGDEINNDPDQQIVFNYSFNIDESLLSDLTPTSFIIKNAEVYSDRSLGDAPHAPDFNPLVSGRVIINPDRTIQYWNFILNLSLSDPDESEYLNKLRDHDIRIASIGGRNTCNCDRFWEDLNLTTQRPYNTWIIAATVDNHYRSESDFNNWSVKQAPVSEPGPLILIAFGIMGILAIRRNKLRKIAVHTRI